jgi:hypothetical protein
MMTDTEWFVSKISPNVLSIRSTRNGGGKQDAPGDHAPEMQQPVTD